MPASGQHLANPRARILQGQHLPNCQDPHGDRVAREMHVAVAVQHVLGSMHNCGPEPLQADQLCTNCQAIHMGLTPCTIPGHPPMITGADDDHVDDDDDARQRDDDDDGDNEWR